MILEIETWTAEFVRRLKAAFGERLLFAGLQGSYGRGEATQESDIDLVVVLEQAGLDELRSYRELVRGMDQGELACGFLCGRSELERWPRFDLLQLVLDTIPLWGSLEGLVAFTPEDAEKSVQVGASALYHAAVHSFLYETDPAQALPMLEKSAFFLARAEHYRRTGEYLHTKREVAGAFGDWSCETDQAYNRLIRWSSGLM